VRLHINSNVVSAIPFAHLLFSMEKGIDCFNSGISCRLLAVPHSTHTPNQQAYYIGDRVTYSCNGGFRGSGWTTLICNDFGRWTRNGREPTMSQRPLCNREFAKRSLFFANFNRTSSQC